VGQIRFANTPLSLKNSTSIQADRLGNRAVKMRYNTGSPGRFDGIRSKMTTAWKKKNRRHAGPKAVTGHSPFYLFSFCLFLFLYLLFVCCKALRVYCYALRSHIGA